jgi:hypothetical protein
LRGALSNIARKLAEVIVVGTDGSDSAKAAVREANESARAGGDRIVLVTAWRELRGDFGLPHDSLIPSLQLADVERSGRCGTVHARGQIDADEFAEIRRNLAPGRREEAA